MCSSDLHVDAVGTVVTRQELGELLVYRIQVPQEVLRYAVEKGSMAVDGVSLTINALGEDSLDIGLIPHTLNETTLGDLRQGNHVNLEADILGKYVERLLERRFNQGTQKTALSTDWILSKGFF